MCAALLRLADLLDFGASRAPDALFRHLGLNRPQTLEERISAAEWSKNRVGVFNMRADSVLFFDAQFDNLQQEKETQVYLDYAQGELRDCIHKLHRQFRPLEGIPLILHYLHGTRRPLGLSFRELPPDHRPRQS